MVPYATRQWKPEIAPHAIVINNAGNKKPEAADRLVTALPVSGLMIGLPAGSTAALVAKKPVNAGMSRLEALPVKLAPTIPIIEIIIMPYSKNELKKSRGCSKIQTGAMEAIMM